MNDFIRDRGVAPGISEGMNRTIRFHAEDSANSAILVIRQSSVDPGDSSIQINRPGTGQPLVTIWLNGRLEYGDGYEPDEAAQIFWDTIGRLAPPRWPTLT